jgi:hypothetical protein
MARVLNPKIFFITDSFYIKKNNKPNKPALKGRLHALILPNKTRLVPDYHRTSHAWAVNWHKPLGDWATGQTKNSTPALFQQLNTRHARRFAFFHTGNGRRNGRRNATRRTALTTLHAALLFAYFLSTTTGALVLVGINAMIPNLSTSLYPECVHRCPFKNPCDQPLRLQNREKRLATGLFIIEIG